MASVRVVATSFRHAKTHCCLIVHFLPASGSVSSYSCLGTTAGDLMDRVPGPLADLPELQVR